MSYDEVEIEDMSWNEQLQAYTYPCPCGDLFQITLVRMQLVMHPACHPELGVVPARVCSRPLQHCCTCYLLRVAFSGSFGLQLLPVSWVSPVVALQLLVLRHQTT